MVEVTDLKKNSPIVISLVKSKKERQQAIAFINEIAFKWYGCLPPPPPPIIFVAKQGHKIVGTVAFNFGDKKNPLPLEKIYAFDRRKTPWPFTSEKIAQCGRFTATTPGVSVVVSYVATMYILGQGKLYGLAELKDCIAEHLRKLGLKLSPISDARLESSKIPEKEKKYYLASPSPKLYMFHFKQAEKNYKKLAMSLIRERKFIIDPELEIEL